MRKIILSFALVAMAISANAQWYVGGMVGLNLNSDSTNDNVTVTSPKVSANKLDKTTTFGLDLTPEVGYFFNDKVCAGLRLGIAPGSVATYNKLSVTGSPDVTTITKTTSFSWQIMPFAMYKFVDLNRFGIWARAELYAGGVKDGAKTAKGERIGLGMGGFRVAPVLTFSVNDHIKLLSEINLLSLGVGVSGYNYTDNTIEGVTEQIRYRDVNFNLGWNMDNAIASIGTISIGCIYVF